MTRRWTPGQITDLPSGSRYRVVPGRKPPFDVDLRLERLDNGLWKPVSMEEEFLMADFFYENEEALTPHRPYWRRSGGEYHLSEVIRAARDGWQAPARLLREQRSRRDVA